MPIVQQIEEAREKFRFASEHVGPTNTELQRAIGKREPIDRILELVNNDDLDKRNGNGFTALHLAVLTSQPTVVRSLMLAGADPKIQTKHNNTPLHFACHRGDLDCAKALVDSVPEGETRVSLVNFELKNDDGLTALHIAAIRGDLKILRYLTKHGAKIDTWEDSNGDTALHLAVRYGQTRVVDYYAKKRRFGLILTNAFDEVPFQLAIKLGHMTVARKLFVRMEPIDKTT